VLEAEQTRNPPPEQQVSRLPLGSNICELWASRDVDRRAIETLLIQDDAADLATEREPTNGAERTQLKLEALRRRS
jgi:hypothetical protein